MSRKSLEEQLQALVDGQIPEADREQLVETLKGDPELLEIYCQYAALDAGLHQIVTSQTALGAEQTEITEIARGRTRKRIFRLATTAAAAALIIFGIALQLTQVPEQPPFLTFRTSPDTKLSLTHSSTNDEPRAQGTLAKGSRAILKQGAAEFNFANGIRAVIQAPADLTVHDDGLLFLNEGSAWFHVPENAIGFQVRSADLLVTDLGTEFGVFSSPDKYDEVQVFSGRVKIEALRGVKQDTVASAGQAHQVDPAGRLKPTPLRPSGFPTTLPTSLPFIHFSFDSIEQGRLTATGTHSAVSTINPRLIQGNSQAAPLVPGVSGQALALQGEGDFIETDWYGIDGVRPRTVAFWTKIPMASPSHSNVAIVGWGDPSNHANTKFKVHAFSKNERGYRPRVSFGSSIWTDGITDLKDENWHHFAITYSGEFLPDGQPEVSIYIDGKPEQLSHRRPANRPAPHTETGRIDSQPLRIGQGVQNYKYTFKGLIDELVIYDGVLSENSLQQLIQTHSPDDSLDDQSSE